MAAAYRLTDEWLIPASPGEVWDVLARPCEYPDWWHGVCLAAGGDTGAAVAGARAAIRMRGFLPFALDLGLVCELAERPSRLRSRVSGDLVGVGDWRLRPHRRGTRAVLDLDVDLRAPLGLLAPVLRPLFAANHRSAMRRGERALVAHLGAAGR